MSSNDDNDDGNEFARITVEAGDVDGIMDALGVEIVEPEEIEREPPEFPEQLLPMVETLADIYEGVEVATEKDSRGRSRKMVRQYADREDMSSDAVGHHLRVLEEHNLVIQDGNRWRIADDEED